jgi:hypothetical protein
MVIDRTKKRVDEKIIAGYKELDFVKMVWFE